VVRVVIVGGGFGGVKTALELAQNPDITITLISQSSHFSYHRAPYFSASDKSALKLSVPLREFFLPGHRVSVVKDNVASISQKQRRIIGATGKIYDYDYVVLAIGQESNTFDIEGANECANNVYSLSAAISLRQRLLAIARKRAGRPVDISVIGAGITGVEIAGNLSQSLKEIAATNSLAAVDLRVHLFEQQNRITPLLSRSASEALMRRLTAVGVSVYCGTRVTGCEPAAVLHGSSKTNSDVILYAAGRQVHRFFTDNHALFSLASNNRVVVNDFLQVSPGIFVIGDAANTPYAGTIQTALHNAVYTALAIENDIKGKTTPAYLPKSPIIIVPIGNRWALVHSSNSVKSGYAGWLQRKKADAVVTKNFSQYAQIIRHWGKSL
jgi:NADH:ubiquinone reductase (H+-translocating)